MSSTDRVGELYKGEIHSAEGQRICRDRIHWVCRQVAGENVLDVGCSQGITAILAAREGRNVLGIDVEESVIAYAIAEAKKETSAIQGRLQFQCIDLFDSALTDQIGETHFDSIILGEILEHQTNPRRLLERTCEFLKPGAVLIGSTPFGLHVHDDHKFTFYLADFLKTIEGVCSLATLEIVDGYFRFTARHISESGLTLTPEQCLELEEQAFLARENRRHDTASKRARRISQLEKKVATLTSQQVELRDKVAKLGSKLQGERVHISELRTKLASAQSVGKQDKDLLRKQSAELAQFRERVGHDPHLGKKRGKSRGTNSTLQRGLGALNSTLRLEVQSGRLLRQPQTSIKKTAARFKSAVSAPEKRSKTADTPTRSASASVKRDKATDFDPYQPSVEPGKGSITVASILDDFSHHCFQYEANLLSLRPETWQQQIEEGKPAFLFCESAWQGNAGQWKYTMSNYAKKESNPLRELLAWCKENQLPTVFWNKEDPPNFDVFIDVASDFDVIFTTDANCVERYKKLVGHQNVFPLPFAAQPAIHNPDQSRVARDRGVCFAGSWRADKYPERVEDSRILLTPALDHGLEIFDRHHGSENSEKFAFPKEFGETVQGSLSYDKMLSAYRAYKAFLNVNSVKDSPTMFSRRVFELMACGTPVITTESVGVRQMLGRLTKTVTSEEEARASLQQLLGDEDYRRRYAHTGFREVFQHHTYAKRFATILDAIGLEAPVAELPLVTILASTNRPEQLENLVGNMQRQIYQNLEVIVLLNSDRFDIEKVRVAVESLPNAKVFSLPQSYTLADCLNHGIEASTGAWLAKFDDDDHYGAHYVSDLMLATQFTDAAVLGKHSYYCYAAGSDTMALRNPNRSNRHCPFVCGATLFMRRDVFEKVQFTPVRQGTDSIFLKECAENNIRIYSADPYNYVHLRSSDMAEHTWKITDEQLLKNAKIVGTGMDLSEVMI